MNQDTSSSINLAEREARFTNTLPLIRKIAMSRLTGHYRQSVSDLVQIVGLNLWAWQQRRSQNDEHLSVVVEKANSCPNTHQSTEAVDDLSQEGWLKIAARASVNEINSFYVSKYHREMPWNEPEHLSVPGLFPFYGTCRIEGESNAEISSLLKFLWREMQSLTLRQRYCFLLSKDEFIDDLIAHGVCRFQDLAEYLELEKAEFMLLLEKLPLADEELCLIITEKTGIEISLKQFWTTRSKARAKLARQLKIVP